MLLNVAKIKSKHRKENICNYRNVLQISLNFSLIFLYGWIMDNALSLKYIKKNVTWKGKLLWWLWLYGFKLLGLLKFLVSYLSTLFYTCPTRRKLRNKMNQVFVSSNEFPLIALVYFNEFICRRCFYLYICTSWEYFLKKYLNWGFQRKRGCCFMKRKKCGNSYLLE